MRSSYILCITVQHIILNNWIIQQRLGNSTNIFLAQTRIQPIPAPRFYMFQPRNSQHTGTHQHTRSQRIGHPRTKKDIHNMPFPQSFPLRRFAEICLLYHRIDQQLMYKPSELSRSELTCETIDLGGTNGNRSMVGATLAVALEAGYVTSESL